MKIRSLSALALGILAASFGCATPSSDGPAPEAIGRTKAAVIDGVASDASQDAVVLILRFDMKTHEGGACTGTLIAPNLVLTARHCVADTDMGAACDGDGNPVAGGEIRGNFDPATLHVFAGTARPETRSEFEAGVKGAEILDDGGTNLCNHDIALIRLEGNIDNGMIAPVRLETDITVGEMITAVGWGVTETTPSPSTRQQRTGIEVEDVGPDTEARPAVAPNEFQVGESICSGDSGGPAISEETGAVLGVVSRGGNRSYPDPNDPAKTCIDGQNLYTKLSPFKDLILDAYAAAGAEPWLEGGEDPRLATPGTACAAGSECRSGLCLPDPSKDDKKTCAKKCATAADCPTEHECVAEAGAHVCRQPDTGLCAQAGASRSTRASASNGLMFALGAVVVAAARRRRRG